MVKCQNKDCTLMCYQSYYVNPFGKKRHYLCHACYLKLDEETRLSYFRIEFAEKIKDAMAEENSQILHSMADQLNDQINFKPTITAKEILEIKISILKDIFSISSLCPGNGMEQFSRNLEQLIDNYEITLS